MKIFLTDLLSQGNLYQREVLRLLHHLRGPDLQVPQERPGREVLSLRRHVHPRHGGEQEQQGGHTGPGRGDGPRHDHLRLQRQGGQDRRQGRWSSFCCREI